jgi:hypothetical protein
MIYRLLMLSMTACFLVPAAATQRVDAKVKSTPTSDVLALVESVDNWSSIRSGDVETLLCTEVTVYQDSPQSGSVAFTISFVGELPCPGDPYSELLVFKRSTLVDKSVACDGCSFADDRYGSLISRYAKLNRSPRTISLYAAVLYPHVPDVVGTLIRDRAIENSSCRGGAGNALATDNACRSRDKLDRTLEKRGWCYGQLARSGAESEWERCRK